MGLLSGVAGLFGSRIDAEKKARIRKEIDLAEAVHAHLRWKLRLQNYLDGKSSETLNPMVICRDDQCDLGRWIHGAGTGYFDGLEPFQRLRTDHAHFHTVAANVVKHIHEDDKSAAEATLTGEYQKVSHRVMTGLAALNQALAD